VRCAAALFWSTFTKYCFYISWFVNLLEPMKIHNFYPQMVLVMLRI
jgi:hypothetical protein